MTQQKLFYFDNNATTKVAQEVIEAMLPLLQEHWGNPSSAYSFGHHLGTCIDQARGSLAGLINAEPREIVFTSGGTESINSAMHSALVTQPGKRHIVTTAVEHSATLKYLQSLQKQGYTVTYLPVTSSGLLDLSLVESSIQPETALVSIMWANNETGVVFPIQEIGALCKAKGVLFHCDSVQAAGKLTIDAATSGATFLSFSGHKLHAPKGIGALYIRRHTRYQPYLLGGAQERGRRGGTENVAGIVALGRAADLVRQSGPSVGEKLRALRDKLESGILERVPGSAVNGDRTARLPNTTNIAFEGVEAEGVLMLLDNVGICASSGSACTTGSMDPSHVLSAMGCSVGRARGSIRLSLSRYTGPEEVDYLLEQLPGIISKLRANAPFTNGRSGTQEAFAR